MYFLLGGVGAGCWEEGKALGTSQWLSAGGGGPGEAGRSSTLHVGVTSHVRPLPAVHTARSSVLCGPWAGPASRAVVPRHRQGN